MAKTPNGMIMPSWKMILGYVSMYSGVALCVFAIIELQKRMSDPMNSILVGTELFLVSTIGTAVVSYGFGWYERGQHDGTTGKDW